MPLTTIGRDTVGLNEALVIALARARASGRHAFQVAAAADVHPSELSRWTHGHTSPSPAQAERVATALGLPVKALFPVNESSPAAIPGSTKTTDAGGPREGYRA